MITSESVGNPSEDYLRAYGVASQAAQHGELTFTVEGDPRAIGWAAMHAYHETGYTQPGRLASGEAAEPDTEEFLSMYHAARLRIAEGKSDITLPVAQPYDRPDLRRAVVEACRETGTPILTMNTQRIKPGFIRRLLRHTA